MSSCNNVGFFKHQTLPWGLMFCIMGTNRILGRNFSSPVVSILIIVGMTSVSFPFSLNSNEDPIIMEEEKK